MNLPKFPHSAMFVSVMALERPNSYLNCSKPYIRAILNSS